VEVKSAWSKTTDRSFKLKIQPPSGDASAITLTVRFTATYPRTLPLRTQKRINNVLASRPKELLGEPMIYDITNDISDAINDAVQAKQQGTLPSLKDERATAEQATTAMLKEAEEAEDRKAQDEKAEEERMLKQMVEKEVNRRESRKPASPSETAPNGAAELDTVTFDTPVSL
jgi:translation initiation factor 2-alpha kinase 4